MVQLSQLFCGDPAICIINCNWGCLGATPHLSQRSVCRVLKPEGSGVLHQFPSICEPATWLLLLILLKKVRLSVLFSFV